MINVIKNILGFSRPINYSHLIKDGGMVLDVRTKAEFQQGHIKNSLNIPINNLSNHYSKLKKDLPIITCCASGVRSAQAKLILEANGFKEVYNGGSWKSLNNKIDGTTLL